MTKTDAAIQTLADINPDVNLEGYTSNICTVDGFAGFVKSLQGPDGEFLQLNSGQVGLLATFYSPHSYIQPESGRTGLA